MKNNVIKTVAFLGMFTALYVVLAFLIKIPLISHIQTDLGYIVFGFSCFMFGWIGFIVGTLGCFIESLVFNGWIPIGWMIGQVVIGIGCGLVYTKCNNKILHIIATIGFVFLGIACIKTGIECILYSIPLAVKMPKNLIAFIADTIPMLAGLFIGYKLKPRLINEVK